MRILSGVSVSALALGASLAPIATAQEGPSYTTFGTPGLIEMPTAESADRSDIAATITYGPDQGTKTSFTYQLSDRLSGSFRYSVYDIYSQPRADGSRGEFDTYDRSFDIQYRLTDESRYFPAVAVGLRDFIGTGRFGSEYVVASKSFGRDLIVTGGIGWGRMGERNGFDNPLGAISEAFYDRPIYQDREFGDNVGQGGQLSTNQFFRGDAAFFGGLEYQFSDKLGFKAEYSSVEYDVATFTPVVTVDSPFNFGVSYRPRPGVELGLNYMYGNEISARATFLVNPESRPTFSGLDPAPAPVRVRTADQRAATTWDQVKQPEPAVRAGLTQLLAVEGITLIGLEITDRTARLRYQNGRFRSEAQAMGRAARMMSQIIPPSVQTFILEPSRNGVPTTSATLRRADLETLENRVGATAAIGDRITLAAAGSSDGLVMNPLDGPRFEWGISPYLSLILFNKNDPLNADVGLNFDARYRFGRNMVVSGRVQQSALGAQDALAFFDNPNDYANVRTDIAYYGKHGGPVLDHLTLTHFSRPGQNLYGRITAGYLERMYGGISGELLWKPVDSRLAIGAEINAVAMRDQDMGLGFAQYETLKGGVRVENGTYETVTGHLTAYYELGQGYHAQLDVGRYLAGDWGATFGLDREFANGWRVGGYFTLTDMPFDQFGEGSFDKGIRVTIPYDYFIGTPSRRSVSTTLQSLSRDGGAKLDVSGRLYEVVRDGHKADLDDTWGRFWR